MQAQAGRRGADADRPDGAAGRPPAPPAQSSSTVYCADEQVVVLLRFALTIGPIAVYFLALGYLNAQPRPQLLSGRADFVLLAVVFFPILLWAMLLLVNLPWIVLASAGFAAALGLYWLMPRRQSSWVIYNISGRQFLRALGRALDELGHSVRRGEADRAGRPAWTVPALGLRLRVSPFPMLQNVTCMFERIDGAAIVPGQLDALRRSLRRQLGDTRTLPSTSAACFILIGTVMLSAPLLMMARHMDEIVKVVRSLFA